MKKRTAQYFQKMRGLKIMSRVNNVDLATFLSATFQVAKSNVVKRHIQIALHNINPAA